MFRHRLNLLFLIFCVLCVSFSDAIFSPAAAQDESPTPEVSTPAETPGVIPELPTVGPVSVTYPIHGQTLKGIVKITGSIALEDWTGYELAFADTANAEPSWFVFATGTNPIIDGLLGTWDTATISDGEYNLRLHVFSPSGDQDVFIYSVRIHNYTVDTPEPTATPPASATPSASPTATATATFTPQPTSTPYSRPTPMPPNPASLRTDEIIFNLGRGALFTALLFGVFGLLLRMRRK
jgi:hypothetical protein